MPPPIRVSARLTLPMPVAEFWRLASDTSRVNRAVGIPAWRYEPVLQDDGVTFLEARTRYLGVSLRWREYPFDWVYGRSFSVLREFQWLLHQIRVDTRMEALPGGRTGVHVAVEMTARDWLGWLGCRLIAANRMMGQLVKLYRRFATTYPQEESAFPPTKLGMARDDELRRLSDHLRAMNVVASALVDRLEDHLRTAQDESVVQMRPFVLAEVWSEPRLEVLRLFLHATRAGLVDLQWSILCPNCRVAKATTASLTALQETAHCDLCHIQFGVNFDEYVELRFTVNSAVRHAVDATYCVGGPATTRHILVQKRLAPGQSNTVRLYLEPGDYRVRTRQLQERAVLTVETAPDGLPAFPLQGAISFGEAADGGSGFGRQGRVGPATLTLGPGEVALTLRNESDGELLALVERASWGAQHVSAALVTSLAEFRRLFSSELLAPGMGVAIRNLTLLFTDLKGSTALYSSVGDSPAYVLVRDHFAVLRGAIDEHAGAVVKTIGDAVMGVFTSAAAGLGAALAMQRGIAALNQAHPERAALCLKVGLHRGPCVAVTANDMLDYFGTSVNMAARAEGASQGGDIVVTEDLLADSGVAALVAGSGLVPQPFAAMLKGFEEHLTLYRLEPQEMWTEV